VDNKCATSEQIARAINRCINRHRRCLNAYDEACANAGTEEMQYIYVRLKAWKSAYDILSRLVPSDK
jgi:hypothetical protein